MQRSIMFINKTSDLHSEEIQSLKIFTASERLLCNVVNYFIGKNYFNLFTNRVNEWRLFPRQIYLNRAHILPIIISKPGFYLVFPAHVFQGENSASGCRGM